MKTKFLMLAMVALFSTTAFSKTWYVACPGTSSGVTFTTTNDVTKEEASAMGLAYCMVRFPSKFK